MKTGIKKVVLVFLALISLCGVSASEHPAQNSFSVNLMIGTAGRLFWPGNVFPGATVPFGLVRLSPDLHYGTWPQTLMNNRHMMTSGYSYTRDRVLGFSHTRLSGAGVSEGGLLRVLPLTDAQQFQDRRTSLPMNHKLELALPGYYSLSFANEKLRAEMTTSVRCGIHRYTKTASEKPLFVLMDVTSRFFDRAQTLADSTFSFNPETAELQAVPNVAGYFSKRYGGLQSYVYAKWSQAPSEFKIWNGKTWLSGQPTSQRGDDIGLGLTFSKSTQSVELRVCVSHVSMENAKLNFQVEAEKSFEAMRAEAVEKWQHIFDKINISTKSEDVRTLFYTSIYRSFLMPTTFTDVNGQYRGIDGAIHTAQGYDYLTDLSIWDTFRTTHPLYTLIDHKAQRDTLQSMLAMSDVLQRLPRWPQGAGETGDMIGAPANFLFAEGYLKGVEGVDYHQALALMVAEAREAKPESKVGREADCIKRNYCPHDKVFNSVSKTVEFAWADYATSMLAKALGRTDLVEEFSKLSLNYRNVWDPTSKFFRPRDSEGKFLPFSPYRTSYPDSLAHNKEAYTEGSPFHWRWYAPHNGKDLVKLFGGPQKFAEETEKFLEQAQPRNAGIFALPMYWHGNQHDLHAIYMFNESGRADLTQKWVRWALEEQYANAPDGLAGNDDGGTLSSWYVFSAMGLYPQAGSDLYWVGAPILDSAEISLSVGGTLKILTHNNPLKNKFLAKVLLNGDPLCEPSLRHDELMNSTVEFFMSADPQPHGGFNCQ